jgi:hypothetical protein
MSHTRLAHRVQPTRSSVRETGTRPELGEPIVIEPTNLKRAPHKTVPEVCLRAAAQPSSNGRPEVRSGLFLSTQMSHKSGTQSAAYSELRAWDWTQRADRNRAHTHKMARQRTVLKGTGPRLSRQVKADLRYGRGCLSPHMWFSDLKILPPQTPP